MVLQRLPRVDCTPKIRNAVEVRNQDYQDILKLPQVNYESCIESFKRWSSEFLGQGCEVRNAWLGIAASTVQSEPRIQSTASTSNVW